MAFIYVVTYVAVDLILDLHTIAYIHVMVTILVVIIVLVPTGEWWEKLVGNLIL